MACHGEGSTDQEDESDQEEQHEGLTQKYMNRHMRLMACMEDVPNGNVGEFRPVHY